MNILGGMLRAAALAKGRATTPKPWPRDLTRLGLAQLQHCQAQRSHPKLPSLGTAVDAGPETVGMGCATAGARWLHWDDGVISIYMMLGEKGELATGSFANGISGK